MNDDGCKAVNDVSRDKVLQSEPAEATRQLWLAEMKVRVLILASLVVIMGCSAIPPTGCPAALLEGELTEQDGGLVVVHPDFVERVDWAAAGYHVRRSDDGDLVVADWLGVKAQAGDIVHIGGGESEPGVWTPCGQFDVTEA